MKRKWIWLLLAAGLAALGIFIFSIKDTKENEISVEDKKIQIGMSFDSFVIERWQRDRDVFVSTAKEYGAEVIVQNANGNVEEQKKQIDYFISKDCYFLFAYLHFSISNIFYQ